MIKRIHIIISFYLFLMSSNITHSHSTDDAKLQNVLSNLLIWLENQNYFNYENIVVPNIKVVDVEKICSIAYGEDDRKIRHGKHCANIRGLYDFNNKTIYISHDVDLNSKKGQAIILHELVHHFQYESGEADEVDNINQLEHLAYFLEKKFRKQKSLLASN